MMQQMFLGYGSGEISISAGASTEFKNTTCLYISSAYDSNSSKVVTAYWDLSNGEVVVGDVSGASITYGTPVQFNSGTTPHIGVGYESGYVVIAYRDDSNIKYGTARVGTVSNTGVITLGGPIVFENGDTHYSSVVGVGGNQVVIAYQDESDSDFGKAVVGTLSGSGANATIVFGNPVVFNAFGTSYISSTYDSTNDKVVIAYRDGPVATPSSTAGKGVVGTVSGTGANATINFGSDVTFNNSQTVYNSAVYDSTNGKVVIAYKDTGGTTGTGGHGAAVVGTVSGTSNDITFGTPVSIGTSATYLSAAYNSNNGKVFIAYQDGQNSLNGTVIVGTASGTGATATISFGSPFVFEPTNSSKMSAVYDSTNDKVVVAYETCTSRGNGIVITPGS